MKDGKIFFGIFCVIQLDADLHRCSRLDFHAFAVQNADVKDSRIGEGLRLHKFRSQAEVRFVLLARKLSHGKGGACGDLSLFADLHKYMDIFAVFRRQSAGEEGRSGFFGGFRLRLRCCCGSLRIFSVFFC